LILWAAFNYENVAGARFENAFAGFHVARTQIKAGTALGNRFLLEKSPAISLPPKAGKAKVEPPAWIVDPSTGDRMTKPPTAAPRPTAPED